MVEFVAKSEDWTARKAAAEALEKLAVVETDLLSEFKAPCLKTFEVKKFDKKKFRVMDDIHQELLKQRISKLVGSVAMVATELRAKWVILDRRLKNEADCCLKQNYNRSHFLLLSGSILAACTSIK